MLNKHLLVTTNPIASEKNIIRWGNYRITVLQDRLFRIEYSENKQFRDGATQSVWYRNMPTQEFYCEEKEGKLYEHEQPQALLWYLLHPLHHWRHGNKC